MFESSVEEPARVLVVEDEKELTELYSQWLNGGFTVEVAQDRNTAYGQLLTPVDVIVVDRNLPDGSGDKLLADIRELGLDCRVVMITAEEPDIDILGIEFDDYLLKPVSEEELRSAVTRLVDQKYFKDKLIEFNQLKVKKALLKTYCSSPELADNEEYAALEDRLQELQEGLIESRLHLPFDAKFEGISSD